MSTHLRHYLQFAFLSLFIVFSGSSLGQDLILESGFSEHRIHKYLQYLLDDKSLSLQQVKSHRFQALPLRFHQKDINWGIQDGAYWYRFTVHNESLSNEQLLLQLTRPLLDDIQLNIEYVNTGQEAGAALFYQTGDDYPHSSRPLHTRDFVFPLSLAQGQTAQISLRVKSKSVHLFSLNLLTQASYLNSVASEFIITAVSYGIVLGLIIYHLMIFCITRERVYFAYSLSAVFLLLIFAGIDGYSFMFLWPNATDWVQKFHFIFVILAVAASIYFTRIYLLLDEASDWINHFTRGCMWAAIFTAACFIFDIPFPIAVWITALFLLVALLIVLGMPLIVMFSKDKSAALFFFAWMPLVFSSCYAWAAVHWFQSSAMDVKVVMKLCLPLQLFIMAAVMGQRISNLKEQNDLNQQKLLLADTESKTKSEFFAIISHEIRTPMNGIVGMSQLLRQTPLSSLQKHYNEVIQSCCESLSSTINDVLDFSKIQAGKLKLELMAVDIDDLLNDTCEIFRQPAYEKNISLSCVISNDVPSYLHSDPLRLKQVLMNLINNAIKFTPGGYIQLHVDVENRADHQHIVFSVKDSGIGISIHEQESLFKAFNQAKNSTSREYGGSGLGLVICQRLAELLGGSMELQSTVGKGSHFKLCLPITAVDAKQALARGGEYVGLNNYSFVLVDADAYYCSMVEKAFLHYGMAIQSFNSLQQALSVISTQPDDVDMLLLEYDEAYAAVIESLRQAKPDLQLLVYRPSLIEVECEKDKTVELGLKPIICNQLVQRSLRVLRQPDNVNSSSPGDSLIIENLFGMSILAAEDNQVNQLVLKSLLAACDCQLVIVSDGKQALEHYKKSIMDGCSSYDAVLMDCEMPKLDGFDATNAIRDFERHNGLAETPIIAITAHALPEYHKRCFDVGMNKVIAKPVDQKLLITILAQVWSGLPVSK